jgi:hypothetical protein
MLGADHLGGGALRQPNHSLDSHWSNSLLHACAVACHLIAVCLPNPSPPLLFQVRNQQDRDAYEKAWREAHAQGDQFQQKWGRAKVQRDGKEWGT